MLTTVAAILANPRYTGRQVWNRQRTYRDALPDEGTFDRHHEIQRWSASTEWVISREIAHTPLVSEENFVAVQAIHTAPTPADAIPRCYLLAGVICCGVCGRIMDSLWVHNRAGYRCRHGNTSTRPTIRRQKPLYVREDHLLDRIRHDSCLRRHHPATRDQDPDSLAGYLRLNNIIIVCDHNAWTIETDTAVFPLTAPTSVLTAKAKIPAQRDGDRSNAKRNHASWGNNVSERICGTHAQHGCSCRDPTAAIASPYSHERLIEVADPGEGGEQHLRFRALVAPSDAA